MIKTFYPSFIAGFIGLGAIIQPVLAQDIHFSQTYMNPQHQNPALTGIFEGDQRASIQYRSQWETVPVQYRTIAAGFESKIMARTANMLSAGLLLQRDQAGDGGLSWTQVGLHINAAHALSTQQILSVGLGAAMVQRKVDISGLTFNNQWDGDIYDPSRPSNETLNNNTGIKASIFAGVNWHFRLQQNSRTVVDAGVSAAHLNRPNLSFKEDGINQLPIRYLTYAQSYIQANEQLDYLVFAQLQWMQKAMNPLVGAGIRYWLTDEYAFQTALALRTGDAVIPSVAIQRKQWTVGLSYDVNISQFKVATNRRGGFEIAVIYTAAPVKPIKEMKVCPVF